MESSILLRPPALRPGDAVAVVSPSWGGPAALPAPYRRGLAALDGAGYRVRVMPNAEGRRNGWTSGTARERADDLHRALTVAGDEVIIDGPAVA
jgi:muramoyltetrapeptide carboxypeptidase